MKDGLDFPGTWDWGNELRMSSEGQKGYSGASYQVLISTPQIAGCVALPGYLTPLMLCILICKMERTVAAVPTYTDAVKAIVVDLSNTLEQCLTHT